MRRRKAIFYVLVHLALLLAKLSISHYATNNFLTSKTDISVLETHTQTTCIVFSCGAELKNENAFTWNTKSVRSHLENVQKIS